METLGGATLTINREDLDGMLAEVLAYRGSYGGHTDRIVDMLTGMIRTAHVEPAWMGNSYTRDSLYTALLMDNPGYTKARIQANELFGLLVTAKGNVVARRVKA
jgi:hypothetical protein